MTSLDEETLAHQARASAEAFAELYRRNVARVYRYQLAHTGNVKDAEDLTSQTFMAAMEGIGGYRGSGSFAAWLMGIARRRKALFFRSRQPETPLEAVEQIASPGMATDQAALNRILIQKTMRALQQISPERAEAISLCIFSGLSALEAGRVIGKSESAIKMLVSRGLQDLRERTALVLEADYER
jgi:RNA polymerase sigma-70 factor (ECF subfamily)